MNDDIFFRENENKRILYLTSRDSFRAYNEEWGLGKCETHRNDWGQVEVKKMMHTLPSELE